MRSTFTLTGSSPTPCGKPKRGTARASVTAAQREAWVSMRSKTEETTCTSMAWRSAPGSFASWSLAPRNDWQTENPSARAVVVIQMSMPKRATFVSQTSRWR